MFGDFTLAHCDAVWVGGVHYIRYIYTGLKVRHFLLIILVLFSSLAGAKDLCPTNKKIPEDMRLPESHYNKKNASEAIEFLSGIVNLDKSAGEWVNVPNALKTIDGYIRKQECIKSGGAVGSWKCSEFCLFMESSFIYD